MNKRLENFLANLKRYIPPDPYGFSWLEILRICFGLDVLIISIVMFNEMVGATEQTMPINSAFLVMAIMIFLMPSSSMFHPRAIIEGNVVSALLATASVSIFPSPFSAMPVAIVASALAIYSGAAVIKNYPLFMRCRLKRHFNQPPTRTGSDSTLKVDSTDISHFQFGVFYSSSPILFDINQQAQCILFIKTDIKLFQHWG
jgi:hypothetical protein